MPSTTEDPYTDLRHQFCLALKTARERRGITLDAIAASTKIPAYLFAGLERGDLRRWPTGLFRRSFFRDYARAIGAEVDDACDEFARLFPCQASPVSVVTEAPSPTPADQVRLAFDAAWHGPGTSVPSRLIAITLDGGAVLAAAMTLAWLFGFDRSIVIALIAIAYFSLGTAFVGGSPAQWLISRRGSLWAALAAGVAMLTQGGKHGVELLRHAFDRADSVAAEPVEEPETRAWITDATRVGPPRLRVRIKVPQ